MQSIEERDQKIRELEGLNKNLERIRKDIVSAMGIQDKDPVPASQMHTPHRYQFNMTDF